MSEAGRFENLIRRVRAGDQAAATELVREYEPAIRRAIRFRLADSRLLRLIDSMDVCQSVLASFFLRAAAGQYDIDKPEQLLKLLVAMAKNKLALQARAQKRQRRDYRRAQSAADEEERLISNEPSPSQIVAGQELIAEAQRRLSDDERRLFDLRRDGMEWSEISEKLGGKPEALRKKLSRAIDRIAHDLHLDDYCD